MGRIGCIVLALSALAALSSESRTAGEGEPEPSEMEHPPPPTRSYVHNAISLQLRAGVIRFPQGDDGYPVQDWVPASGIGFAPEHRDLAATLSELRFLGCRKTNSPMREGETTRVYPRHVPRPRRGESDTTHVVTSTLHSSEPGTRRYYVEFAAVRRGNAAWILAAKARLEALPGVEAAELDHLAFIDPGNPSALRSVRPSPRDSNFEGRGKVLIRVRVALDGTVAEASVERTELTPALDEAALEAARRWIFRPATSMGRPVSSQLILTFRFPWSENDWPPTPALFASPADSQDAISSLLDHLRVVAPDARILAVVPEPTLNAPGMWRKRRVPRFLAMWPPVTPPGPAVIWAPDSVAFAHVSLVDDPAIYVASLIDSVEHSSYRSLALAQLLDAFWLDPHRLASILATDRDSSSPVLRATLLHMGTLVEASWRFRFEGRLPETSALEQGVRSAGAN